MPEKYAKIKCFHLFFAVLISATTGSCSLKQTKNPATLGDSALVFRYEPSVSTVTGILTLERFWGPPGYGEDTTTDKIETEYILALEKPITVVADDSSGNFEESRSGILNLEIVTGVSLDHFLGKRVSMTGGLFGAVTGHHHTDVLMTMIKIEE
jgi:Domain of unknown function (DUF4431)